MVSTVQVAPSGPIFSRLVAGVMKWGVWGQRLSPAQMLALIEHCLALGITTFDHADIYGDYTTEAAFGEALAFRPALRARIQLVTKCGIRMVTPNRPQHRMKSYDTSAEHIVASAEQSLCNLRTDYLDLLLLHRPDVLLHPDEVAEAFSRLQQAGRVLHFGVSNFTPSQFVLLHERFKLVTNQVEASVLHLAPFHDGTFDQCLRHGIRPMAWSPLGGGRLFSTNANDRVLRIRKAARALFGRHDGATEDQLLLAWLLRHPAGLLPVLGTTSTERLSAAAVALDLTLSREDWYELWQASVGQEVD